MPKIPLDQSFAILERATLQLLALGERVLTATWRACQRVRRGRAQPVSLVRFKLAVEGLDAASQEPLIAAQLRLRRGCILCTQLTRWRQQHHA